LIFTIHICTFQGIAFQKLEGILYPCVGLQSGSVKINFGHEKFQYAGI